MDSILTSVKKLLGIAESYTEFDADIIMHILSLIHISEPTRRTPISYAVFCLKKKKKDSGIYEKAESCQNNRSSHTYKRKEV